MKKIKVFKGGTLFDGTGGNLIKDAVVVMEDDKFGAVGVAGEVQIPEGPPDFSGLPPSNINT